ncbi:hypothetical protein LOAG_13006 [Loa loa]|uniref:Uncharacterized protein n=1 Tax=Loa loa TaxID=7209 RepID=A0A1S0TK67_LOALO|nr:hypothetical protein LOAG_13006 [Loa loa]EFO15503.1 hypothetical protein LOAG_13006 [Loa loa]
MGQGFYSRDNGKGEGKPSVAQTSAAAVLCLDMYNDRLVKKTALRERLQRIFMIDSTLVVVLRMLQIYRNYPVSGILAMKFADVGIAGGEEGNTASSNPPAPFYRHRHYH